MAPSDPDTERLRRLNLDSLVAGGGFQPIARFAPLLPPRAVTAALSEPKGLRDALASFDVVRRNQIVTAVGAASAARAVSESITPLGKQLSNRLGDMFSTLAAGDLHRSAVGLPRADVLAWAGHIKSVVARAADAVSEWRLESAEGLPEFVAAHGWSIPAMDLTPRELAAWVSMTDAPRREVRRAVFAEFSPGAPRFRRCRDALLASDAMARHRPALRQGIRAFERGDRYAAICTLLPLVEGAIASSLWEAGEALPKRLVPAAVKHLDNRNEDGWRWLTRSLEVVLVSASGTALFDSDSYGRSLSERHLNRHSVLHGRSTRYGTANNTLRLFLVLCTVAEVLEHVRWVDRRRGGR